MPIMSLKKAASFILFGCQSKILTFLCLKWAKKGALMSNDEIIIIIIIIIIMIIIIIITRGPRGP